jgi:hypothetical protein
MGMNPTAGAKQLDVRVGYERAWPVAAVGLSVGVGRSTGARSGGLDGP